MQYQSPRQNMHTPGPWAVMPDGNNVKVTSAAGDTICKLRTNLLTNNAQLIAAAPDLLKACEWLVKMAEAENEACGIYKAHIEQARAAIKSAKGE